jgi:hypothetical protein
MLHWLGVKPSYSRPRVSDDNAFVESLFRNAKYRPEFPAKGFADLDDARTWATRFVHWYNHEYRHSGIRYVARRSAMPVMIAAFSRLVMRCTPRLESATRVAGHGPRATGRSSRSSSSTQSATSPCQTPSCRTPISGAWPRNRDDNYLDARRPPQPPARFGSCAGDMGDVAFAVT